MARTKANAAMFKWKTLFRQLESRVSSRSQHELNITARDSGRSVRLIIRGGLQDDTLHGELCSVNIEYHDILVIGCFENGNFIRGQIYESRKGKMIIDRITKNGFKGSRIWCNGRIQTGFFQFSRGHRPVDLDFLANFPVVKFIRGTISHASNQIECAIKYDWQINDTQCKGKIRVRKIGDASVHSEERMNQIADVYDQKRFETFLILESGQMYCGEFVLKYDQTQIEPNGKGKIYTCNGRGTKKKLFSAVFKDGKICIGSLIEEYNGSLDRIQSVTDMYQINNFYTKNVFISICAIVSKGKGIDHARDLLVHCNELYGSKVIEKVWLVDSDNFKAFMECNNIDWIKWILETSVTKVDQILYSQRKDWNILHYIANMTDDDVVDYFLSKIDCKQSDISGVREMASHTDECGYCPIHIAALKGSVKAAKFLLKFRALRTIVNWKRSRYGWTTLGLAIQNDRLLFFREILEQETREHMTDNGFHILELAIESEARKIAKYLVENYRIEWDTVIQTGDTLRQFVEKQIVFHSESDLEYSQFIQTLLPK